MTNDWNDVITARKNCKECDGERRQAGMTEGLEEHRTDSIIINFQPLKIIQHYHHRQRLNEQLDLYQYFDRSEFTHNKTCGAGGSLFIKT